VIPAYVPADAAIPVIRWGRLVEVTFWSTIHESSGLCVRLLEHHDVIDRAGRISYALFEGEADELGRMIPLTEHPDVAHLAAVVDETGAQPTGLDRLDVVRVPNAGPQRRWRKLGPLKYHGRSDMDGNEPIFDRIDESWTSWMTDIRNGRGRITVPEYMLQSNGPGRGAGVGRRAGGVRRAEPALTGLRVRDWVPFSTDHDRRALRGAGAQPWSMARTSSR
jgi:hypothetical protein